MELDPKKIIEVLEKYEAEADQIFLIRSQVGSISMDISITILRVLREIIN